MQITCKINQNESIKRGFNTNSTIKLDVDVATLTPAQREILAEFFTGGELRKIDPQRSEHRSWDTWLELPQPDLVGLSERLDAVISYQKNEAKDEAEKTARKQAEKSAEAAKVATYIATPESELIQWSTAGRQTHLVIDSDGDVCSSSSAHGRGIKLLSIAPGTVIALKPETFNGERADKSVRVLECARAHNLGIYVPLCAIEEKREAAEKSAAAKLASEKSAALTYAVETFGSETQKRMFERGLLSETIILGWLEVEAFSPVKSWELFVPLTDDDCEFQDEDDAETVTLYHRDNKLDTLTEEQFSMLAEMERLLPGCDVEVRSHVIEDDNDSDRKFTETRCSLDVTVSHRAHTFTRSFSL